MQYWIYLQEFKHKVSYSIMTNADYIPRQACKVGLIEGPSQNEAANILKRLLAHSIERQAWIEKPPKQ